MSYLTFFGASSQLGMEFTLQHIWTRHISSAQELHVLDSSGQLQAHFKAALAPPGMSSTLSGT